ncbi:T9SS type A sorting domain-containing protein [Hymenobacter edaphi]|uniref:Secretion system C-terminal sorting domain-containing protein n=1 Tax=Hymenobacter edaphi TaxID=2211146 RepID=A0A328BQR1_9BACT|nr:T9SS type A sorting domain-containing protein [Hymenobacter edaphi]RAK69417.1 hypothetical protein DLM85_00695 [Hymenobacter edaphi]
MSPFLPGKLLTRRLVGLLAFLLLGLSTAQAQTYWTGNVSSDWHNPQNWNTGVVPGSNTAVVVSPQPYQDRGYYYTTSYSCGSWPNRRTCYSTYWQPVYYYPPAPYAASTITCGSLTVTSSTSLYATGAINCTSLSVASGASLSTNGALSVSGDLTVNGTLNVPSATVAGNVNYATNTTGLGSGGLVLNGSGNQTLVTNGAALAKLTIDKSAGAVVVNNDLTISSLLAFTRGMVQTSATSAITMAVGASVTGETAGRYVKGNLITQANNVSGMTSFGNGVTINATSPLGTVTVKRTAGLQSAGVSYGTNPASGLIKGIDQIWEITPTTQPTAPVPVTFNWVADNDNGLTFTQARVWKQETAADPWRPVGGEANASATRSITVNAPSFSRWTVSNVSNPLPVELLHFTAQGRGADALLRWSTATEHNNSHFLVEVSTDGHRFQPVGQVAGRGNSLGRSDYQFVDERVGRYGQALLYYRLRQVDHDGTETMSPLVALWVSGDKELVMEAFPNPFRDNLKLRINAAATEPATLTLQDRLGRMILSQAVQLVAGVTTVELPRVYSLAPGIYVATVRTKTKQFVTKVVRE